MPIEGKKKNAKYKINYRHQKKKQNLDSTQEQPNLGQEPMAGNKQKNAEYHKKSMKAKRQNESEEEAIECKKKNAEYQRKYRSQKKKQNLDGTQEQPHLSQELMAGNKKTRHRDKMQVKRRQ